MFELGTSPKCFFLYFMQKDFLVVIRIKFKQMLPFKVVSIKHIQCYRQCYFNKKLEINTFLHVTKYNLSLQFKDIKILKENQVEALLLQDFENWYKIIIVKRACFSKRRDRKIKKICQRTKRDTKPQILIFVKGAKTTQ